MNKSKLRIQSKSLFACLTAVLFAVVAPMTLQAQQAEKQQEKVSDVEISNAVDDELISAPAVPAYEIDVTTQEGIVTLTGDVTNILAKERAAGLAKTVKGVRGVVNQLEVDPTQKNDLVIDENVEDALSADPATESWEIVTTVNEGKVTLSGTVESWQEKQLAATVVKGVAGVTEVQNDLEVDYETDRSDHEIETEVESALRWDRYVDDSMISVSVEDGEVTLAGTVGSSAEKTRARSKAWVTGVTFVNTDDLQVEPWAKDEDLRKGKYEQKSDKAIKEAIQNAFLYDPRVSMFDLAVEVTGGYVTLRGEVTNVEAKRVAAQDARNIVGVWGVRNQIKVRPEDVPSDERIERKVQEALDRDPLVERYEITVTVNSGIVHLYGTVDSTFEKAQADDVAARQKGVVTVKNFLNVSEPDVAYEPFVPDAYPYDYDWYDEPEDATPTSDWAIEEEIEDEMFWDYRVDAEDVTVEVEDAVATLKGTVDTWTEYEAAKENAWEGGAVAIEDELIIDYGPEQ